jgi:hypothetical protein
MWIPIEDLENAEFFWKATFNIFPFTWIYRFLLIVIIAPLKLLYFHGPEAPMGFGFWAGRALEDICHELTHGKKLICKILILGKTSSEFWKSSPEVYKECEKMVLESFYRFLILCGSILYWIFFIFALYLTFKFATSTCAQASRSLIWNLTRLIQNETIRASPARKSPNRISPKRISPPKNRSPMRKKDTSPKRI